VPGTGTDGSIAAAALPLFRPPAASRCCTGGRLFLGVKNMIILVLYKDLFTY
jgi:hypothetical protein